MGGQTVSDEECVELCIESGGKFVLVSGGNVYAIANQKDKNLKANIGHTVEVEGELDGATITVSKIVPSHKKPSKRP